MSLPSWTSLLAPADPEMDVDVIEAGPDWGSRRPRPDRHVIWGGRPRRAGIALPEAVRHAVRREGALVALRRDATWGVTAIHRLPAPRFDRGLFRDAVRARLLGGVVVELSPRDAQLIRVIDRVVNTAGVEGPIGEIHAATGDELLLHVHTQRGPGVLRVAVGATAGRIERHAAALLDLDSRASSPSLLSQGRIGDVSWMLEERLPGHRPRRIDRAIAQAVMEAITHLPRSLRHPVAVLDDLHYIGVALPGRLDALTALRCAVQTRLGRIPAIARHGDLWRGNLLVRGSDLLGIVDWDAWHPRAIPGADLLQLVAAERRRVSGRSLGEEWRTRPWRSRAFAHLSAPYWRALAMDCEDGLLELVGLAWWAAEVAGTLRRLPDRARDRNWVDANVVPALDTGISSRGTSDPATSQGAWDGESPVR